jgi:PBP1b-binding outer membrane lipoprotein LpoB
MKLYKIHSFISLVAALTLIGCASTDEKATTEQVPAPAQTTTINDFPTRDRVEYVLNCVAQHGGLTFVTQYACGCKIDKIAEKMSFADYEAARTFSLLKSTPGEAGGVFRDPQQSKDLRKQLKEADAYAEKQCFVK